MIDCTLFRYLTWLVVLGCCVPLYAEQPPTETTSTTSFSTSGIPAGFESLTEPQTTFMDVYYGGVPLATVLATYTLDGVSFEDPAEILQLIPAVKNPNIVLQALSGTLETNADKVCFTPNQTDCGTIFPEVAGVIFDDGRFRIDIFINPNYLEKQAVNASRYLPPPTADFSTINAFDVVVSGETDNDTDYTVTGTSVMAYQSARILSQWDYSNENNFSVDTLSLQQDFAQYWEYEVGFFGSRSSNALFVDEQDLLGFRVGTSLKTRTDLAFATGNEIFLFLPQRSRVDIFKDDRLVSSAVYNAGNQQIDTSRLPDGAYNIVLRIRDDLGNEIEEEQFFIKSSVIPPIDQPVYFIEAGEITDREDGQVLPQDTNDYFIHLGHQFRLFGNTGVNTEIFQAEDQALLQTGLFLFGGQYQLQADVMGTTESDTGISFRGTYRLGRLNASANYLHVEAADEFDPNDLDFDLIPETFTQATATVGYPLLGGQFNFLGRYNDREDEDPIVSYGFNYLYPIYRTNRYFVDLNLNTNREDGDLFVQVGLRLSFKTPNWSATYNAQTQYEKNNDVEETNFLHDVSVVYSQRNTPVGDIQAIAFAAQEEETESIGGQLRSQSDYGEAIVDLERIYQEDQIVDRYSATARFNIATGGADISIGGRQTANAGVIVHLESDSFGELFEIFVNGQAAGFVRTGQSTIVPLRPL